MKHPLRRDPHLPTRVLCCQLFCLLLLTAPLAAKAAATPATLQLEPGPVQFQKSRGVSGSFRLVTKKSGLLSTGTGGGCLLADFSASLGVHACTTHADCNAPLAELKTRLPPASQPNEAHGYCTRAAQDKGQNTCWFRPGPRAEYCYLSPTTPWTVNQTERLPQPPGTGVVAQPLSDGKPVRWMVYTCLNAFDSAHPEARKDHPGCARQDPATSVTQGGKAKTIKPGMQ